MPKQMCFLPFYGSIFDNLEFSQHIESCGIRILNTKKVGFVKAGFSIFANLCLLPLRENWSYRFP